MAQRFRIEVKAKTIEEIKHSKYFRLGYSKRIPYEGFLYYDDFDTFEEANKYLENLAKMYYPNKTERLNYFNDNKLKLGYCTAQITELNDEKF